VCALALAAVMLTVAFAQFGHAMAWNSELCAGVSGILYYLGGCWAY
jgi:hypothetical protein